MDMYLVNDLYDKVWEFNHKPDTFDHAKFMSESIERFRAKQKDLEEQEEKDKNPKIALGPQSHSKTNKPMLPGQTEYFILDEIKRRIDLDKKLDKPNMKWGVILII